MTIVTGSKRSVGENSLASNIQKLEQSKFVFHLTGSRFFGNHNADSDYDYFTQNTNAVCDWLEDNGYEAVILSHSFAGTNGEYADDNCAIVLKHTVWPIHIQLQNSVEKKIKAQEIIKNLWWCLSEYMNKTSVVTRRDIWNAVYRGLNS